MFIRVLLYSLLTVVAVAQAPDPAAEAVKPGSIEGRVITTDGSPVRRATVKLTEVASRKSFSAEADGDGRFAIAALEPGSYMMNATRAGYISNGQRVSIAAGGKLAGVTVTLVAQSIIEGRTLDEYGDPLPHMQVTVYRRDYSAVRGWSYSEVKKGTSGADGRYSIGELEAWRYYVSATDPKSNISYSLDTPADQQRRPEYVTTYFPNATSRANMAGVEVAASSETRGIDIRMQRMPLYRVSGKVEASGGKLGTGAVSLEPGDSSTVFFVFDVSRPSSMVRGEDGEFHFPRVQPGTYQLLYREMNNGATVIGRQQVLVTDKDHR